ncbi:MAG: pyruvate kinase [Lachnospiraceae bacterium]|nr:pyruvate kinase [Lachnospiraceae bacterium]
MRKTNVICTIGPSCENEYTLRKMATAGMNCVRINLLNGDRKSQQRSVNLIKSVRSSLRLPLGIMLDIRGPECRIGTFQKKKLAIRTGDTVVLTTSQPVVSEKTVFVSDKNLPLEVAKGDVLFLGNSGCTLRVCEPRKREIVCQAATAGTLTENKSVYLPGRCFNRPFLSDRDREDIVWGVRNRVDMIAVPSVSKREEIEELREFLDRSGGKEIRLIAKLRNRSGIENVEEICKVADGIMVSRAELGTELRNVEVAPVQKELTKRVSGLGKYVVTSTELLESMIQNDSPTLLELSDIVNAVYDGSTAVLLSAETAIGKYPVEAVRTLAEAAAFAEESIYSAARLKGGFGV